MVDDKLIETAGRLLELLRAHGRTLATAESCTGGLIAATLTAVAGSSDVLERGFVTYSNAAKSEMLGVPDTLIAEHGAVSAPVAEAMAQGALERAPVDLALSVTGIAGPGGATATKPVGLVLIGLATRQGCKSFRYEFAGDRRAVREKTVGEAFMLLYETLADAKR